jgi:hypothetical protein
MDVTGPLDMVLPDLAAATTFTDDAVGTLVPHTDKVSQNITAGKHNWSWNGSFPGGLIPTKMRFHLTGKPQTLSLPFEIHDLAIPLLPPH